MHATFKRFQHWLTRIFSPATQLHQRYQAFRTILQLDSHALNLLTELESHISGQDPADHCRITHLSEQLIETIGNMVDQLKTMNPSAYQGLTERHGSLSQSIRQLLIRDANSTSPPYILPLDQAADYPRLAGGKAANLSAAGRAGVTIPKGFVITANACHRFIEENNLTEELTQRFQQVHTHDHETIIRITGELQELMLKGKVPEDIVEQIQSALETIAPFPSLAVRSSALAEDGKISFAGQYASELEVEIHEIIAAYKRVIAGKYCPRALAYRIRHGLSDDDTTMAALVVPMISPRISGVVYSLDPGSKAGREKLGVYAVSGLAEGLVDGSRTPAKYYLSRDLDYALLSGPSSSCNSFLSDPELKLLRQWSLLLEDAFRCPQDIEWALSETGLTILQSRPLHQKEDPPPAPVQAIDLASLLYSDLHCAAPGVSCGPVFHAPNGKAFLHIPPGSVVYTPTLRPSLSQFLDKVTAVIAESGSRASHFSSVARERGIPVLVGEHIELQAGQVITVDAASGRIFKGCINTVLQTGKRRMPPDFPTEKYSALAERIIHLGLTDPDGETFSPDRCLSLHDIVRFCHEKCVREMFTLVGPKGRGLGKARKLATTLPLTMYVLEIENPKVASASDTITLEMLSSLPMRALWRGMSDPHIYWDTSQHHIDWEGFDQVSGGIFSLDSRLLASYAIVAKEYMHLNIRFGYHFSIVDSICGEQDSTNYVNFRFKGGGAAHQQQMLRLECIDQVLTAFGFETSSRGDLLDANFSRASQASTERALSQLGLLLAATRMMDMRMTSSQHATEEAEKIIALAKSLSKYNVL